MRLPLTLFFLSTLLPGTSAFGSSDPDVNFCQEMEKVETELQRDFYKPFWGTWREAIWWNFPNMLVAVTESKILRGENPAAYFHSVVKKNRWKYFTRFRNDIFDDELWWALAMLKGYDVSGKESYLNDAKLIHKRVSRTWGDVCPFGGVQWKKRNPYVNSVTNELYFLLSARLAQRSLKDSEPFISASRRSLDWFTKSGLYTSGNSDTDYILIDGLDKNCLPNTGRAWSYNQGIILAALAEHSKIDPSTSDQALKLAASLAQASSTSSLLNSNGIMTDFDDVNCNEDSAQFKGVYFRDLGVLNELSSGAYDGYIFRNAASLLSHGRDPRTQKFTCSWTERKPDQVDKSQAVGTKTGSALALLVEACRIQKRSRVRQPEEANIKPLRNSIRAEI